MKKTDYKISYIVNKLIIVSKFNLVKTISIAETAKNGPNGTS